jgi:hypothetical protein
MKRRRRGGRERYESAEGAIVILENAIFTAHPITHGESIVPRGVENVDVWRVRVLFTCAEKSGDK